jgi:hypothetical protein
MAVSNPSGLTIINPQTGVQYTKVTDSSADWTSVANSTYFYDLTDKIVYYKNSSGIILSLFAQNAGTTNYVAKFNTDSTIGNSVIQDNGTNIGINATPLSNIGVYVTPANTVANGIRVNNIYTGASQAFGLIAATTGASSGTANIGVFASAGNNPNANFGIQSTSTTASATANNVGGSFQAANGLTNYALQLKDGTETLGKFLKCVSATNGYANWADLTFIPELKPQEVYRGISFSNNSTTVVSDGGVVMSTTASTLAQTVASTNLSTKQIRLRYYASVVSGGRYSATRGSALLWFIHGGFRYICDFNISDTAYSAGCQQFYGLAGQTTDLAYGGVGGTLVNTLTNIIGVGSETGDTNLQVFHNDATGTATKVDLGIGFPANRTAGAISTTVYSITLYNVPMSTDILYRVVNNETAEIAEGTLSTNLPLSSQGLNFYASRCMSTTSVTGTGQFDLSKLGVYSLL